MSDPAGLGGVVASAAIATAATLLLTPISIRVARRWGLVDRPGRGRDGYKAHPRDTPVLGGVAVAISTACPLLWSVFSGWPVEWATVTSLWLGLGIVLVAGLLDDVRAIAPQAKLFWQLSAALGAGFCLSATGVRLELFLDGPVYWVATLTVLWVVGVTNAVNFLDNMNGLCAGLGAIAATVLAIHNIRAGDATTAMLCAALAGACLGFMPFNWPRASSFLGDSGSMFIGFGLAALCVKGVYTRDAGLPVLAVAMPLVLLAVPLTDLVFVSVLRARLGHPFWLGDRRHISHRLVRRGMHPAAAVAALWAVFSACGAAALLLPTVGPYAAVLLVALVVLMLGSVFALAGSQGLS